MAKLQSNYELISDKSKNPVVSSEYVKHGTQWLSDAVNTAVTTVNSKADKTYVDAELAKKASKTELAAKADASTVTALQNTVNSKADASVVAQLQSTVNTKANESTVAAISDRVTTVETDQTALDSRMSAIEAGTTPEGSEVIGIRTAADGKAYPTAGDAVRAQVTDLKSDLTQFKAKNGYYNVVAHITSANAEFNFSMERGCTYTFSMNDYPNSTINFYANSSKGIFDKIGEFKTNIKSFSFTASSNIEKVYITCYANYKDYSIDVVKTDSIEKISEIKTRAVLNAYNSASSCVKVNLKAGNTYTLSIDSLPSSTINFFTDSAESNKVGEFKTTAKSFTYTPSIDVDYLYTRTYVDGVRAEYNINIYKINDDLPRYKPVILDTDFGGDIDDLSSVAVLLWAERMGMCDVVGIHCSVPRMGTFEGNDWQVIPAIDAVCTYFGADDIAFGLDHTYSPAENSNYCGTAVKYRHKLANNMDGKNSAEYYRRALSSLPDGEKCDVAIVGFTTGFSLFLDSTSDKYSPLNGVQLANEKIDTLWIMGGQFPNGKVETNLAGGDGFGNAKAKMVNATNNIFTNFKGRIVMVGAENGAHCGDVLFDNSMTYSMLYQCMNQFMTKSYNNGNNPWGYTSLEQTWKGKDYAWDVLTVLCMCENNVESIGFETVRGTVSINNDSSSSEFGKNSFTTSTTGSHYYVKKMPNITDAYQSHIMDSIIEEKAWGNRKTGRVRLSRK